MKLFDRLFAKPARDVEAELAAALAAALAEQLAHTVEASEVWRRSAEQFARDTNAILSRYGAALDAIGAAAGPPGTGGAGMSDAPNLLPCPFCGGDVITDVSETGGFFICSDGGCKGSGLWAGYLAGQYQTAVAAWNTRALPAVQPAPAVKVGVKPLEWEVTDWSAGDGVKGENDCEWQTVATGLHYIIDWQGRGIFCVTKPDELRIYAGSLAAAKTAAQADYAARILAALEGRA